MVESTWVTIKKSYHSVRLRKVMGGKGVNWKFNESLGGNWYKRKFMGEIGSNLEEVNHELS
jgi:hypothetical protein